MNNICRRFLLVSFLILISISLFSQNKKINNLRSQLPTLPDTKEKCQALGDMSIFFQTVSVDSSRAYGLRQLEFSESINCNWGIFDAMTNVGNSFLISGDLISGEEWIRKSLNFADSLGKVKYLSSAYGNLGNFYYNQNDYSRALDCFYASMDYNKMEKDTMGIAKSLTNISTVLISQNKLEDAIIVSDQAIDLLSRHQDSINIAIAKMNIGVGFMKNGEFDRALPFMLESINFLETNKGYWRLGIIYLNAAVCYEEQGELGISEVYYNKAYDLSQKVGDTRVHSKTLINRGNLYLKSGRVIEAEKSIKEGLEIALQKIQKGFDLHQLGYKFLADVYKQQNKYQLALQAVENRMSVEDSLFNTEKNLQIESLIVKFQTQQKQDSIALLQANQIIDERKIQQQKIVNYSLWGILSAAIVILGLIYSRFSLKKKQNIEIQEKNDLLSNQKHQIETLNEELNHRVKNNLQLVSSLMRMQHRRLNNDEAKSALKESENRIKAMALIHERLHHQKENIQISLSEYLTELIDHLRDFYKGDYKHIKIESEMDEVITEAEPAIRIGLIINELVTNGFKHAFPKGYDPTINIQLKKTAEDAIQLIYSDTGQGLSEHQETDKLESLGMKLIKVITNQLDGKYAIRNEEGVTFQFDFTLSRLLNLQNPA